MAQPTIEQAKAFCEVAETRSYAEAARRLGHSRAGLIRLVDRFAKSVGRTELFGPSRRGQVQLTAAGGELLDPARRFVAAAEGLVGGPQQIRFSAYPIIVQQVMAEAPDLLEAEVPLLLDDVSEERRGDGGEGLVRAVVNGRLDLVAAPSRLLADDELESRKLEELHLYDWKLRVVLPRGYSGRSKKRISPAELAELEISAAPPGHRSRHLLEFAFESAGVPLWVDLESSSQHTLRSIANSRRHAAVIPDDAFGSPDEDLGPCLTDGRGQPVGDSYSLYLRTPELKSSIEAGRREVAILNAAQVIQRKLSVQSRA